MNTIEPKEFKEFVSQFSNDYLQNNYKEIVKEFSIKENTEKNRKAKPPLMVNNQPIISFYSLEQYKEMTIECLSKPLVDKEVVIQTLLQKYINNPLKNVESDCTKLYQNIRAGQISVSYGNSFLFYSRIVAIEELIKFENYLLNILKNNSTKAENTFMDFIHNVKDKGEFVLDFKEMVQNLKPTPMMIAIEGLKLKGIILLPYGALSPFVKQLGILLGRKLTQQSFDKAHQNENKFDIDVELKVKELIIKHRKL